MSYVFIGSAGGLPQYLHVLGILNDAAALDELQSAFRCTAGALFCLLDCCVIG